MTNEINSNGGGTVTPPTDGDNGNGGGTVTPPTDGDNGNGGGEEEAPYRITELGNSGMEFSTIDEATAWAHNQMMDLDSYWSQNFTGFVTKPLMWSNGEVLSHSIDFYN